jgi:hypothetical protein
VNVIISLIISLSIALGAPVQPSQAVSQPPVVECMEDMPCWDSATMGTVLPALEDSEVDAWETVSRLTIVPANTSQALEYNRTLDYMPESLPLGQFAISSFTSPNTYHVMQWVTLYHA